VTRVDDPAIESAYDFIVCGSGSSGSVVARRLAENPDVSVLLLEACGTDDVPAVMRPDQWASNLNSERAWQFTAQANPHLNGRAIPYAMGKVLGGGSSINVMSWVRGPIAGSPGVAAVARGQWTLPFHTRKVDL
jgi:choline dehydrogenase